MTLPLGFVYDSFTSQPLPTFVAIDNEIATLPSVIQSEEAIETVRDVPPAVTANNVVVNTFRASALSKRRSISKPSLVTVPL